MNLKWILFLRMGLLPLFMHTEDMEGTMDGEVQVTQHTEGEEAELEGKAPAAVIGARCSS